MTVEASVKNKPGLPAPPVHPIRLPDFRRLWLGATAVSLGVQFYAVALVWLVLYLTDSGVQLGALLTAAAIPRAISMLLSGALIDRYPPRRLLIISAFINGLLMTLILILLGAGWMSMAALFLIAPVSGLVDAIFYPTSTALIPRLVPRAQLASANALIQTADTIANIAGPSLSGVLIGEVARLAGSPLAGLVAGFAVNAALFALGFFIFLSLSRRTDRIEAKTGAKPAESLGRAVLSGIRYALVQPAIRVSLLLIAMLNFAAIGPIVVGGALLVERRFGGDATMYGVLMGSFGIGMLLGALIIGQTGQMRRPGMMLLYTTFALALGLAALGLSTGFWVAFAICFVIGIFASVTNITSVTWLQVKTEMHMQGRMASLLVFSAVALDPFSNAISGVVAEFDITLLFLLAAGLLLIGGALALLNRTLREEVPPQAG